ncbi:flagellin protein FlaA [alpha proteobacterium U9-1i]|nr:flagellin protein FlaA [alpha proteobacterium U9-1i]
MVSSILPGATGANALGVDTRFTRTTPLKRDDAAPAQTGDRVEISAASWSSSRESVRAGLEQVHLALAIGHDAQGMLLKVQELARNGGSQEELDALLQGFSQRLQAAIDQGAKLVAGEDVNVDAEPGGSPVTVAGADLRLKAEPGWSDVIAVPAEADADSPAALARAAQKSLDTLQGAMERLLEAARALEAHQGFLGAVESAVGVRTDLDAEAARLTALQVRQGLQASNVAIANTEPQAVLTLFRA